MNDELSFHDAMLANPEDDSLRLVFADWLEERGDPRGELVRLLHTLTQSVKVRSRKKLEDRVRGLVSSGVKPVGPFFTNSYGIRFAWIPPGVFLMGSPPREKHRETQEVQHPVTLTRGFYLSSHLVTQTLYRKVMRKNPSEFGKDKHPVTNVSWDDAHRFMEKVSKRDGYSYRLPTEAEWEYACRAGTTSAYFWGDTISDKQANCDENFSATDVDTFLPNAFGVHDMHGNAWEWCSDWYGEYSKKAQVDPTGPKEGTSRVVRGGSYGYTPEYVRSAIRNMGPPDYRGNVLSFRVAMTLDRPVRKRRG